MSRQSEHNRAECCIWSVSVSVPVSVCLSTGTAFGHLPGSGVPPTLSPGTVQRSTRLTNPERDTVEKGCVDWRQYGRCSAMSFALADAIEFISITYYLL